LTNNKMKLVAPLVVLFLMCSVTQGTERPVAKANIVRVEQMELSAEVWSENFDDHNISDWSVFGVTGDLPFDAFPGNFTAEEGVLRANGSEDIFSVATKNSSVAYGTWSFDVEVVETSHHEIVIPFIMLEYDLEDWFQRCYFIQILSGLYGGSSQHRLRGAVVYPSSSPGGRTVDYAEDYEVDDLLGWWNIIITREDDGQFYVYLNETLVLNFKDSRHTTCEEFMFITEPGPAMDNILVSDTVDFDAASPEWEPEPTDQVIELGQDFRYDLNATDFSGVDTVTWTVNDTTNFAIDSSGVITNIVDLAVGTYGLDVSVSDNGGYTRSAIFTVTVESPEAPQPPDITLYLMLGGGGIVIVALVVILMRKR
jgi:hypothetical protein